MSEREREQSKTHNPRGRAGRLRSPRVSPGNRVEVHQHLKNMLQDIFYFGVYPLVMNFVFRKRIETDCARLPSRSWRQIFTTVT